MFTSLLKAAASVVTIPVAVVADAVTLGGALNERDEPYTLSEVSKLLENLQNVTDPDGD